ncbi:Unknown protein sequence [Pseudomonas syringae pv. helianthi]|uniref:Uncharacterized protein n=1 Tax=Pseudomonas syringae pv. helianthi TaxID=251654 RepID=A0A0P9R8L9_9PSED|nr:Unknown protein sequence [Pseudomonas syringae pv. helianthi]RMW15193.1 hypothetical protein ALO98_02772 [Pseudomonas syringae pv. tagetis]
MEGGSVDAAMTLPMKAQERNPFQKQAQWVAKRGNKRLSHTPEQGTIEIQRKGLKP